MLIKSQSNGLDDLLTIFGAMSAMSESTFFIFLDLTSGFLQLKLPEADRHLTAFRDAEGNLPEYIWLSLIAEYGPTG